MDKLTSSPTASSQCHVCNLCYEDRTKNRFPSLRCFFGFVFFWGESNQSWMGSNPPIPLDHYSPLGLKSKEMSFSNRHKLKWFMKEIALTLSWIFGTCQTSVGLLPSLQFSWLTFNPPNSTNNKDTLKERILKLWFTLQCIVCCCLYPEWHTCAGTDGFFANNMSQ